MIFSIDGEWLKARINTWRHSPYRIAKITFYILWAGRWLMHFLSNARFRSEHWGILRANVDRYQLSTFTKKNRYPLIFRQAGIYLSRIKEPRILSFGCSIGEEVAAIRQYIPQAYIVGVDINSWCIKQCRRKHAHPKNAYFVRNSGEFETEGGFDAIFCMAVFQRTENRKRRDNNHATGFLFQQFADEIQFLDKKLKAGGLMIIDHSDFRFLDTDTSRHFTPLEFDHNLLQRPRPLFDRDNRKISDTTYEYRVFVKYPREAQ